MARDELSISGSVDSNATKAPVAGAKFCWKQFCCALIFLSLLIGACAIIYIVVDGNSSHSSIVKKNGADQSPIRGNGRNVVSGGKEGTVKAFNWCGANKKMAVLTFDDGPSVAGTPNVLRDLAALGAKGTFFVSPAVNGEPDASQCDLIKRILDEGHSVQSHSWDHKDFMNLNDQQVTMNLQKNKAWIEKCAGSSIDKLTLSTFRPPFGSLDFVRAQFISNELGYKIATWNMETEDYKGGNATTIMGNVTEKYTQLIPDGQESVIVLMHDKSYVDGGAIGLLPLLVNYFDKKGYTFGTTDQCYEKCDPYVDFCKMEGLLPGVFEQP
jgi:peptidoglycan/xylan/chitin deacetylase (PgdA/CDA1 family)